MNAEIAGRLRQRIRIEKRLLRPDGAGGAGSEWESCGEHWAEMSPVESLSLSTLVADTRLTSRRWRVLVRSGIDMALGMRVLWRGLDLRVTGVEADPRSGDRLLVIAEEFGA
jgi:head-tail adaptor